MIRTDAHTVEKDAGRKDASRIRSIALLLTLVGAVLGSWCFWLTVTEGGVHWLEWIALVLFVVLFTRLVFSFVSATIGFIAECTAGGAQKEARREPAARTDAGAFERTEAGKAKASRDTDPLTPDPKTRTAILVPVYNESPQHVAAGVLAMIESLWENDAAENFDIYILSDTTRAEVWLQEEVVWQQLTRRAKPGCGIFYRHRPRNTARKAGNIADFCCRWGSRYRYMLVLDADSLMSGETVREMVRRMDADPRLGILQVPPLPIGRNSLFARLQQFAAHLYGPIFVRGFAKWAGDCGNYWGHNAILRVSAFLDHCALPNLPGEEPLGGEILSHDFVEAALVVRGGWKVQVATDLGGSYEECPTTLADYAQRDQRWCQGNLQHAKLLMSEGFHPISRLHFLGGVMAYVASPLWLCFTVACLLGIALDGSATYATVADDGWHQRALLLFVVSMALLFAPKIFATATALVNAERAAAFGGRLRLVFSVLIEMLISILLAPIMAVLHTRFVTAALTGRGVRWTAQQRNEHGVGWREAAGQFWTLTAIGVLSTIAIAVFDPALLVWFSPILIGLVLAIPVTVAMGSVKLGRYLKQLRLLIIPEERAPSKLVREHQRLIEEFETDGPRPVPFESVVRDPEIFQLHHRLQRDTDANLAMPEDRRGAIVEAFGGGKPNTLSPQDYRDALLDEATLQALLRKCVPSASDS